MTTKDDLPQPRPTSGGKTVELNTDQRRALKGRRPLRKNYIARHWRGELGLGRAFWLNNVLINIGLAFATAFVALVPILLVLWIPCLFAIAVWQLVGLWRCANTYMIRGGWDALAGLAKFVCLLGWVGLVGNLAIYPDALSRLTKVSASAQRSLNSPAPSLASAATAKGLTVKDILGPPPQASASGAAPSASAPPTLSPPESGGQSKFVPSWWLRRPKGHLFLSWFIDVR